MKQERPTSTGAVRGPVLPKGLLIATTSGAVLSSNRRVDGVFTRPRRRGVAAARRRPSTRRALRPTATADTRIAGSAAPRAIESRRRRVTPLSTQAKMYAPAAAAAAAASHRSRDYQKSMKRI